MAALTLGDLYDKLLASYSQMAQEASRLREVIEDTKGQPRAYATPIPDEEPRFRSGSSETNLPR